MARPTKSAWKTARERWESNPKENFESVGSALGVSRVAASKMAQRQGWARVQTMGQIAKKAQLRADAKVTPLVSDVSGQPLKSSIEAAIDLRADVLQLHREDWKEHRKLFPLVKIAKDFEKGKQAKISAEMTLLRQKGEQAAYGLGQEQKHAEDADSFESLLEMADSMLAKLKP